MKLNIGKTCECKEWLLNVKYCLKRREGLLPAGYAVAKSQMTLVAYKNPSMELKNVEDVNVPVVVPQVEEMMDEGAVLSPNFWRAPTDNDFGAGLQRKFAVWKNPELKLASFKWENVADQVQVTAEYEMKSVSARLNLTYVIKSIAHVPFRYANADAEVV